MDRRNAKTVDTLISTLDIYCTNKDTESIRKMFAERVVGRVHGLEMLLGKKSGKKGQK